jgi:K(+)-stimulated pyrophosphate-energized sodium pump
VVAVLMPIIVGFLLGAQALGGFLAGIILTGQLMAVFMSNTGGAWDNAKKFVEKGHYGGKRSEQHKATIVGDTVGDPFKDTAGPALNPMIKVVNLVSLLAAPLIVTFAKQSETDSGLLAIVTIVMVVLLAVVLLAVYRSKRGSGATESPLAPIEQVEKKAEKVAQTGD